MTRWLLRVYDVLIWLYPPDLRRDHRDEIQLCARDAVAARGGRALPRLFSDFAVSLPREWVHVIRGFSMTGTGRDIAYALRLLRRSPVFSAAAIATLALGIGANAAIFSLAYATLLRPLNVARPGELYALQYSVSYPDLLDYQKRSDLYAGVIGYNGSRVNAIVDGRGEFVGAGFVSANYFDVLGIPPAKGRLFRADDDAANGPGVVVLTQRYWRSRFSGDPNIVGRTIAVNNLPVTIVGIAGRDFHGTSMTDPVKMFLPLTHAPRLLTGFFARPGMLTRRGASWVNIDYAGREAVGSRLRVDRDHWIEIVGIAEDAKIHDIDEPPEPFLYSPVTQDPFGNQVNTMHLLVRTAGDERSLLAPLAEVLRSIDSTAPVYDISTFNWRVRRLMMPQWMGATLFGAFATLALALSALGIYAVAEYTARLRTREIGIRIALGADRTRIRSLVLSQGSFSIAAGLVAGLITALFASRLAAAFLRGVSIRDPLTYVVVSLILACLALLATWIPARRAARLDPMQALRAE